MKKRKPNKKYNFVSILKFTFFILTVLVVLGALYFFVLSQLEELRKLEFSDSSIDEFLDSDRESGYGHDLPFTLIILTEFDGSTKEQVDGFVVVQLNTRSGTATVISIHPDIYFYSRVYCIDPDDSQLVRIKDLFVVGELETPPRPCAYTVYSMEELLAVRIDGFLWVKGENIADFVEVGKKNIPQEQLEDVKGFENWGSEWNQYWIGFLNSVSLWNIWKNRGVITHIESNMDVISMYNFLDDFKSIKSDQIYSVTVSDELLDEVVNNRGDVVSLVTEGAVDESLEDHLVDLAVEREQARVEIFNGSRVNGLGARYRRWIDNLGADVIRVQNAPGEWEKTTVYITDIEEFPYTLEKVTGLWGEDVKVIEERPDFITTGDIIIVLGLDFSQY